MSDSLNNESKLVVHHLNNSRSQRILWLLEELEVPYEIKKYRRTPQLRAPEELKAVNPLGTAPVITDDGVNISESGAIVEYIIRKYGNGKARPPTSGEVHDLYYSHYAEGSLMPLVVNKYILSIIAEKSPFLVRPVINMLLSQLSSRMFEPRMRLHANALEEHLAKSSTGWLAGGDEPTSADYMMLTTLEMWNMLCPEMLGPRVQEYIKRSHDRAAFQKALEKGGEYAYAKL
ncbi:thioredoxin-like protein [Wolfiporia cocos MD-104 SS10]|uniref:glutathione transferase n=1 Tax=Wolfiporia cocos (strain MD-104) TaxID=742152 RepID=A0A2H3JS31_WOLCO|nr:thioredoxin-like protein [Wolfiporia cocos MD-104 SS10]